MDRSTTSSPVLHVSQVRERTGLPPTTCGRILRSPVAERLLEPNGTTIERAFGWVLGGLGVGRVGTDRAARPVLVALRDETEETCALQVRHGPPDHDRL